MAREQGGSWAQIAQLQLRPVYRDAGGRAVLEQRLAQVWRRIWNDEGVMPAAEVTGG